MIYTKCEIECKDWKIKVPVKEIEAFHTKCDRIGNIDRKVVVSSNGFQKDAYDAAKELNIVLYQLEELSSMEVLDWITIISHNAYTTERLARVTKLEMRKYGQFSHYTKIPLIATPSNLFIPFKDFIYNYATKEIPGTLLFLRDNSDEYQDITISFKIPIDTGFYIVEDVVYELKAIYLDIEYILHKSNSKIVNSKFSDESDMKILELSTIFKETGEVYSFVKRDKNEIIDIVGGTEDNITKLTTIDPKHEQKNQKIEITKEAIIIRNYNKS